MKRSGYRSERAVKYFVVQALASQVFVSRILFISGSFDFSWGLLIALGLKLGVAPFHFWYPSVAQGLRWGQNILLMVTQKLAPLHLIFRGAHRGGLFLFVILSSCLVGGVGGLNQTHFRKIIAFSSINHMSWVLAAITISSNL